MIVFERILREGDGKFIIKKGMKFNMNNLNDSNNEFIQHRMIENKESMEWLDSEWVHLIFTAKRLGIEKNEVREFIKKNTNNGYG